MAKKIQVPDFLSIGKQLIADSHRHARIYCLQWFDDSFQNQGFTDTVFQPWPKRNPDRRPGGALLVDTTFLRKSLGVLSDDGQRIEFGSHVPYARIHNNGDRVRGTRYVRAHHRANPNGKRQQVKAHSRKVDLTYKKRQFIGHSAKMMHGLDSWLLNQIEKRFKEA